MKLTLTLDVRQWGIIADALESLQEDTIEFGIQEGEDEQEIAEAKLMVEEIGEIISQIPIKTIL